MIELSEAQLHGLRSVQIELLHEARRVCEKHGIRYSMIGGTLLGAIRHKGYIPWDDDIDIGLLRDDYERFRVACEKDLDPKKYYFQDDRNDEHYRWGYGKLRRKDTLFQREHQDHLRFGQEIFIDVFPLDYAPDVLLFRMCHAFYCFCIRKMLWSPVGAKTEENPVIRKLYQWLQKIPKRDIYHAYYRHIRFIGETDSVRLNLFPTRKPYGFPKKYFEELQEYEFEDDQYPGTAYYDEYLRIKYGDYQKLPPVEERKIHPVSAIKLLP